MDKVFSHAHENHVPLADLSTLPETSEKCLKKVTFASDVSYFQRLFDYKRDILTRTLGALTIVPDTFVHQAPSSRPPVSGPTGGRRPTALPAG